MTTSISIWQRIRRTPYQAIGSILLMFITLFVMAVFLLMAGGSQALLSHLEAKPKLTVFFKDEKTKESIDQFIENIKTTQKVSEYKYISKDEALTIYQQQNKDDPLLLEMVTADILPSSLEISATNPKFLQELKEIADKEPGVDDIVFQKDVVDTLISWASTVRKIGAVFLMFLIISTVFILLTSIGMKIASKKEEIKILKLVGATNWYIRKPFIYEGLAYGAIGATLAWITVSILLLYINPFLTFFLQGISSLKLFEYSAVIVNIWPPSFPLILLLWLVLLFSGLLIGFLGSIIALSRYIRY